MRLGCFGVERLGVFFLLFIDEEIELVVFIIKLNIKLIFLK